MFAVAVETDFLLLEARLGARLAFVLEVNVVQTVEPESQTALKSDVTAR